MVESSTACRGAGEGVATKKKIAAKKIREVGDGGESERGGGVQEQDS